MWVARDKDGSLELYVYKPQKSEEHWIVDWNEVGYKGLEPELFPEVKWEDPEPTEVELVIKKK